MYIYDKALNLVTVASPIKQNLALLDADEHLNAETMAVIHGGFVNVMPLSNTGRRAKYVPVTTGSNRGSGVIKQVIFKVSEGISKTVKYNYNYMDIC